MKTILLTILLAVIALSLTANAQSQKIAYIESDVIFKQLPEAQEASKILQDLGNKWQDTLMQMKKSLDEKAKQLDGPISEEGKTKIRTEAEQLQQVALAYREAKFGNDGELNHKQQDLVAPIKDKVTKAIDELAKEEKIGFVFDKGPQSGLLFADDKNDITFKVLDRIKRGK